MRNLFFQGIERGIREFLWRSKINLLVVMIVIRHSSTSFSDFFWTCLDGHYRRTQNIFQTAKIVCLEREQDNRSKKAILKKTYRVMRNGCVLIYLFLSAFLLETIYIGVTTRDLCDILYDMLFFLAIIALYGVAILLEIAVWKEAVEDEM